LSEFTSAVVTSGRTGTLSRKDVPKSPRTKCEIQSQYWVRAGRSVPSRWLSWSTECWSARPPRIVRPTSPGRSCDAPKTMMLSSQSVMTARPRRLRMKRAMGGFLEIQAVRHRNGEPFRWRATRDS
jgi:hypothetical protein